MAREVMYAGDETGKQVKSHYNKVLGKIAEKFDMDIVLVSCHGKYETIPQNMDFDKLYIFVQMLPRTFDGVKLSKVKGFKVEGKEMLFPVKTDSPQPCPQGDSLIFSRADDKAELIRDDNDEIMAVVYDGALYIVNDFHHCRSAEELKISNIFFDYVFGYAMEKTNLIKSIKSGVEEKSRRALETALKSQYSVRLDKEKIQLKAAQDTIIEYQKGIVDATRKAMTTERIVEAIQRNMGDVTAALEKTWKSLQRMNNSECYEKISFLKTGLKAVTRMVYIKDKGNEYEMGRYEVNISFDGKMSIINLDHRIDNYDHPHISNGQPCWGNFKGEITKFVGASEFDVALHYAYTWLCNWDSGSPYKSVENWPKKKKQEAPKEEGLKVI